jgi:YD repeat-containing protein
MVYNAAGNLISKTDFNGKTTIYAYNELNRLITKIPVEKATPQGRSLNLPAVPLPQRFQPCTLIRISAARKNANRMTK